ncbi:mynd domain containing protein [Niveomyces insectorum RCEF 264]|uniref:MYND-type zinc finger protein samB n=1 Tax=Niveomyces insectorum RCEF 264 TaxID=1081102 RepID=A0A167M5V5_9HYPO|nr:mynd domain containing protein [Niveomyces insectorum RCEF 264]
MREVNFSIPNVNKASVGITTALYDRRALDCTSTLPLINSLNHLAYLTTSSARIRDILTVDGGIERLVCILKQGRSKDMMDMWKWNLAFQCVVNIGVRGTEAVRTRVVEADMVPVIATILDNYIKVIERCRERAEEAKQRQQDQGRHRANDLRIVNKASSFSNRALLGNRPDTDQLRSFRRQAPPPSIDVSASFSGSTITAADRAVTGSFTAASPAVAANSSLSAASSIDGSSSTRNNVDSSNDNDATPTMSQFHITSPEYSTHSSISSPSATSIPALPVSSSSLQSPLAQLSTGQPVFLDRNTTPSIPRHFHHHGHHHHHHHHHHHPSSNDVGGFTSAVAPASSSATITTAAAVTAAATSATPARRTTVTPSRSAIRPLASAALSTAENSEMPFLRGLREFDQYAASIGFTRPMGSSQPASPTTPLPPPQLRSPTVRPTSLLAPSARSQRRPSIRHQNSTSGAVESDDMNAESVQSDEAPDAEMSGTAEIPTTVDIQDITMEESNSILGGASIELTTPTVSETQDTGAFNITHREPLDGSIINTPATATAAAPVPTLGLSPNRPTVVTAQQPIMPTASVPRYLLERQLTPHPQVIAAMPREEDVLMSLQLLAYVSKYCNLRTYFQKSHLVPRLMIGKELQLLDGDDLTHMETWGLAAAAEDDEDDKPDEEEYLLPNDLNIFPLVEKFTVRYHSTDMQYWAGVVMRNLCRKDETRGGIRQCAYYQCGKWEKFTRQFAKCRRCRRTKYCSKECQKSAWAFHRHWCVAATQ